MYRAYWNLDEKPFRNTFSKKYFFYSKNYEEAYVRLLYSITDVKGLFLLTSQGGCGKSFMNKILAKDMLEQGHRIALIKNPNLTPTEFLQQLLDEFGLDYKNKNKIELLNELKQFVIENKKQKKLNILIIDEAHLISNLSTFEEIRLLLNLEEEERHLISIILTGKTVLNDILRKVPSLLERVELKYQIQPLDCEDTGRYIYFRLKKAGCGREIFSTDAIKEIYKYSGGIPRKINNICDLALLLGYGENAIIIDQSLIMKAVTDLNYSKQVTNIDSR